MLRFVVFAAVAAFAFAQWNSIVIDTIHGFRMEYDDRHNIVIMANSSDCFIVTAEDNTWDNLVENEDQLHSTSEVLYKQIRAGTGITRLTQDQEDAYHSTIERYECRRKDAWKITFTPTTGK